MSPGLRRLALTAHVACSVGWIGAVAAFVAIGVQGLVAREAVLVRAADVAMDLVAWTVILPFSLASLATGVVQSLGTSWGLFRHHWVVAKLFITVVCTGFLLLHMSLVSHVAARALETQAVADDARGPRTQLVVDSAVALIALLVATALGVYKPKGLTSYGRRRQGGS